jgi:hypothetical protein
VNPNASANPIPKSNFKHGEVAPIFTIPRNISSTNLKIIVPRFSEKIGQKIISEDVNLGASFQQLINSFRRTHLTALGIPTKDISPDDDMLWSELNNPPLSVKLGHPILI